MTTTQISRRSHFHLLKKSFTRWILIVSARDLEQKVVSALLKFSIFIDGKKWSVLYHVFFFHKPVKVFSSDDIICVCSQSIRLPLYYRPYSIRPASVSSESNVKRNGWQQAGVLCLHKFLLWCWSIALKERVSAGWIIMFLWSTGFTWVQIPEGSWGRLSDMEKNGGVVQDE